MESQRDNVGYGMVKTGCGNFFEKGGPMKMKLFFISLSQSWSVAIFRRKHEIYRKKNSLRKKDYEQKLFERKTFRVTFLKMYTVLNSILLHFL